MLGISPEFIWIFALILLGAAIFYATRKRPLTGAERERSEAAARRNWGKEDMR